MDPHRKGELTEAIVIAELKRREIPVSVPFGDNERYDLLVEDDEGDIWKAQVKTGHFDGERVEFRGYSIHTNSEGNVRKSYDGDVDFFVVYCDETAGLYLVPEGEVGNSMALRVAEAKQDHRTINWADDYRFDERWPPEGSGGSWRDDVIADLRSRGVDVFDARETDAPYEIVLRTDEDAYYRASVRPGSTSDGRVRFDTGRTKAPGADAVDLVLVRCRDTAETYLVRRDAYEKSISFRVESARGASGRTNLAADYRFGERWPPTSV